MASHHLLYPILSLYHLLHLSHQPPLTLTCQDSTHCTGTKILSRSSPTNLRIKTTVK